MHLVVVLIIAVLVLGPKKLPEVGRSLGSSMRGFKASLAGEDEEKPVATPVATVAAPAAPVVAPPAAPAPAPPNAPESAPPVATVPAAAAPSDKDA